MDSYHYSYSMAVMRYIEANLKEPLKCPKCQQILTHSAETSLLPELPIYSCKSCRLSVGIGVEVRPAPTGS